MSHDHQKRYNYDQIPVFFLMLKGSEIKPKKYFFASNFKKNQFLLGTYFQKMVDD